MNVEIDNASVKNGVVEEFAILRIDLSSKKKKKTMAIDTIAVVVLTHLELLTRLGRK